MGEPWEFDDNPVQSAVPPSRSRLAWLNELSDDVRFTIIAWVVLCGLAASVLTFVLVWDYWLAGMVMPHWEAWGPAIVIALILAASIASVTFFIRGLFFTSLNPIWLVWGGWLGVAVGALTFAASWFSAAQSWGWLLGLAFGWIPAAIVAVMAAVLAWALAPAVLLLLVVLGAFWLFQ